MIKKIFLISLVSLFALSITACSHNKDHRNKYGHKMFSKMDLNGDNVVTKEEHQKFSSDMFNTIDVNKDGKICESEFWNHMKNYRKDKKDEQEAKVAPKSKEAARDANKEAKANITKEKKAKKAKK